MLMVQTIFGESAILQDMVDYVNNRGSIAPGWFVTPEQQAAMVDMCQASGWEKPDEFSLDPVQLLQCTGDVWLFSQQKYLDNKWSS